MKFPYIPVDAIIAELQDTFKKRNMQGKIDPDTMQNWAVECIREIGGHNYEAQTGVLDVHRHAAVLPKGLLFINHVWEVEQCADKSTNSLDVFRQGLFTYQRKRRVFAADGLTQMYVHPEFRQPCPQGDNFIVYVVKSPPPVIQLSVPSTRLAMTYYGLKKDSKGQLYMQDEVNSIKCVKAFLIKQLLLEDFTDGQVPKYIYDEFKNEYDTYLPQAQAMMLMETPEEMDLRVEHTRNRYNTQ